MNENIVRVLWCDLDGTLLKGKDELGFWPSEISHVQYFERVRDILINYKINGWRIVAVTNQGGVAMGHLTHEQVQAKLQEAYRLSGGVFDKMMACTHHPDAPDPMMGNCWCRKPRIGMLVDAGLSMSEKYKEIYPPHLGLFVGDRPEDAQCAENAGLPFMDAKEWREGGWQMWLD